MTSLVWKRKAGGNILKDAVKKFEANAKDEENNVQREDVDFISMAPTRKVMHLEDALIKSNRLRMEGVTLAESERYWEAMRKWDEALHFTPLDERLYEMKAQALIQLNESFPAVAAAQKAVELNSSWWIAYQTLGRAQLGLGEVQLALKSFARAVHLNPADLELWTDDLWWAYNLVCKKQVADKQLIDERVEKDGIKIMELEAGIGFTNGLPIEQMVTDSDRNATLNKSVFDRDSKSKDLKKIPPNYVIMRN